MPRYSLSSSLFLLIFKKCCLGLIEMFGLVVLYSFFSAISFSKKNFFVPIPPLLVQTYLQVY